MTLASTFAYHPYPYSRVTLSRLQIARMHEYQIDALKGSVVLIGLPGWGMESVGYTQASHQIREALYTLQPPLALIQDLGDWTPPATMPSSSWPAALARDLQPLMNRNIRVVLLGGGKWVRAAIAHALSTNESWPCLGIASSKLQHPTDWSDGQSPTLYNYAHLGYQSHISSRENQQLLRSAHHDMLRFGDLEPDIALAEPTVRGCHALQLCPDVMPAYEAPAVAKPQPFGLSARAVCQLAWYAAHSPITRMLHLGPMDAELDHRGTTATALATALWYFAEGTGSGRLPKPGQDKLKLQKVHMLGGDVELRFFTDTQTNTWWLEVPGEEQGPPHYVPCHKNDYVMALDGDVPDIFLSAQARAELFQPIL